MSMPTLKDPSVTRPLCLVESKKGLKSTKRTKKVEKRLKKYTTFTFSYKNPPLKRSSCLKKQKLGLSLSEERNDTHAKL